MKDMTQKHRKNLREKSPHLDLARDDAAKIAEKFRIKYGSTVPSDDLLKRVFQETTTGARWENTFWM